MENRSIAITFTLSGLAETRDHSVLLFSLTLLFYCIIVLVNVVVIMTIILDTCLHEPMYIFLCNLCINGLFGTAGFYPKFLMDLLSHYHVISYEGCVCQTFVIYFYVCSDVCILAVMAYDRYVAICRPLEYHSVMTKQKVAQLISFSWFAPLGLMSAGIICITRLQLCGSQIQKLFCAYWLIAKLSCTPTSWITSTTPVNVVGYVSMILYICNGIFIVCTYMCIIKSCLNVLENQRRFMQTCVPHLIALFNISIAGLFDVLYMRYGSFDLPQSLQNFLAMEIVIVPPLFNPFIYGLTLSHIRNKILHLGLQKK